LICFIDIHIQSLVNPRKNMTDYLLQEASSLVGKVKIQDNGYLPNVCQVFCMNDSN
jgi:hypothetical protein